MPGVESTASCHCAVSLCANWAVVHGRERQASALPGAGTAASVALALAVLVAATALAAGALGWRERRAIRTG